MTARERSAFEKVMTPRVMNAMCRDEGDCLRVVRAFNDARDRDPSAPAVSISEFEYNQYDNAAINRAKYIIERHTKFKCTKDERDWSCVSVDMTFERQQ